MACTIWKVKMTKLTERAPPPEIEPPYLDFTKYSTPNVTPPSAISATRKYTMGMMTAATREEVGHAEHVPSSAGK
jgi:hypothetical protein